MPDGHNAQACNDAAMAVLKRYGIRHSDIILSINDTTNTSLATNRLIVSTDGTCNMHLANLVATMRLGSEKGQLTRRLSTHSKNARTCTWPCVEWSGTFGTKRSSRTKSTMKNATNRSATMWLRLASIMTHAFQATSACTNRRYDASGHCTNILLTRSRWCAMPTSYQTNVGSPWLRSEPSYDQFAPYHSRHRSTRD